MQAGSFNAWPAVDGSHSFAPSLSRFRLGLSHIANALTDTGPATSAAKAQPAFDLQALRRSTTAFEPCSPLAEARPAILACSVACPQPEGIGSSLAGVDPSRTCEA